MFRAAFFVLAFSSMLVAQPSQDTTIALITSAANGSVGLAPGSLATTTGTNLADGTAKADSLPWPISLDNVMVEVTDSASATRPAGLLFVSSSQINFQIPDGTAPGPATVAITNNGLPVLAEVQIQPVAPGLLAMNDLGVAAATAVRLVIPTRIQSAVPVFRCVDTPGSCRLLPIELGVDTPVYLSFYGTGIARRSSLANVTVTIGTAAVQAVYAGPQGTFPGLDQINVPLPLSLRGAGVVSVMVTVDGVTSNAVQIEVM